MKKAFKRILGALVIGGVIPFLLLMYTNNKRIRDSPVSIASDTIYQDTIPIFYGKSPQDGLMEALEYYRVKHPQIVYAQAVLETGNFKSGLCVRNNNLFGLYNSKKNRYYTFNHWTESIVAYLNYVQYKYKPPNDYYEFLQDMGYAEDPDYTNKVKEICKQK